MDPLIFTRSPWWVKTPSGAPQDQRRDGRLNVFLRFRDARVEATVWWFGTCGGFHSHGGTPSYGWFMSWKIYHLEMDDDWG